MLTHEAFYGWGLTTLDENQMIYYGFGDPVQAAETAIQKGNNQIYLIWWTNGTGWYGQSTLPTSFEEVYRSGRIVLYQFIVAN